VLLRLKTVDLAEMRLWLTRRYIKLLWPLILKLMEGEPMVAAQEQGTKREAVLAFRHQEAVAKANFSKPYDPVVEQTPLGDTPILVSRLGARRLDPGRSQISMHPEQGQGIDLNLDEELLHSFARLLQEVVSKCDWDMHLALPKATGEVSPTLN